MLTLLMLILMQQTDRANCSDTFTQPAYSQAFTVALAYGTEIELNHWRYADGQITINLWQWNDVAGKMVVRWHGEVVVVWTWDFKVMQECRSMPGEWQDYLARMVF